MKQIIIYALVFICLLGIVSAADFTYTVNETTLPFITNVTVILNGVENLIINITYGTFTSGVSTKTFVANTTSLTINVSIPANTTPTNYTDIINITSNNSNFNANITFDFIVLNETLVGNTSFVQVDINEYSYTVCDFLLPYNTTLDIVIAGEEGQTIQTIYNSDFFDFPDEFIVPAENISIQTANIHLRNLSVGSYKETIKFNVVSIFDNVTFNFEILDCVAPFPNLNQLIEVCSKENKTVEEFVECERLKAEQQQAIYEAILEASETKIVENKTVEYRNFTKRVPVLDLEDKDLIDAIKALPTTIKQLIVDNRNKDSIITQKDTEISSLQSERDNQIAEFDERLQTTIDSLAEDNRRKQNTINFYEDKFIKRSTIWWSIAWVVVIILIVIGIIRYNEQTWW
tara:strand:- start:474 stop:1682 length:1209 start_codon:yes stop_codon:yes gene_type:complete